MKIPSYPEMNKITMIYPNPQILLGEEIYWTEKRDGSQLRLAMENGEIKIATHHQEDASEQFKNYLKSTEQYPAIVQLLRDTNGLCENPAANFDFGAVIFGELLSKGKSPARFEHHEKCEFIIFDIWSAKDERFLSYTSVYQHAYHYSLPVVECWSLTRHIDMESLFAERDKVLSIAKEKGREGVVLKSYSKQIFAKEKLDTPVITRVIIEDGNPKLPQLPDSEVLGAIAKVHTDLGDDFKDKAKAMPMIAKYVSEEQEKHLCSRPIKKLFEYYQNYMSEINSNDQ